MATDQEITTLTSADEGRLRTQRGVVERYLADDGARAKYATAAGKLGTLRAVLDQQVFKPTQTYELQCLGIVLGDALVQELKLEWVMVRDAHGRDPAVRVPGTTILVFPLTMISKRVERGDKVDVFELFNTTADQIDSARARGGG